jgi:hypothetical protein
MPTRASPCPGQSVARGIWRRSTSRGSRSRCQPAISARIASWRDRPARRLRSANRSTASRNSRIISRQMPARSGRSTSRACRSVQRSGLPHFLMELHVGLCCAVPNSRWVAYHSAARRHHPHPACDPRWTRSCVGRSRAGHRLGLGRHRTAAKCEADRHTVVVRQPSRPGRIVPRGYASGGSTMRTRTITSLATVSGSAH